MQPPSFLVLSVIILLRRDCHLRHRLRTEVANLLPAQESGSSVNDGDVNYFIFL